jgi:hypothetical protein
MLKEDQVTRGPSECVIQSEELKFNDILDGINEYISELNGEDNNVIRVKDLMGIPDSKL